MKQAEPNRPQRIVSGVERFMARTPTLPPATHTNSYALGTAEVLLVEPATPYEDERRSWITWAQRMTEAGQTPTAIFITHHHHDHVAGAAALSEALRLPLWAHEATAARTPDLSYGRLLMDGEQLTLQGPEPQQWQVLHTPGHAPGHLCLHEKQLGVLVVGDMVASEGTILIDPVDGDLIAYLEQLERLEKLQANVALPAHGAPIETPSKLFRHYIEHRLMRESKVLQAVEAFDAKGADLEQLVARAYADTPKMLWPLAKLSLRSHLNKLESEKRITRVDATWHTRPAQPA